MKSKKLGVGIVGMNVGISWASRSHLPALRHLCDTFEVIGVANRSAESAKAAAAESDIPHAFDSVDAMVACADIDIVAVTVRVPGHRKIVEAALRAGKHVYCEWPLALDLDEARLLTDLARETGRVAVIGTQAMVAPEIEHVRALVAQGRIGRVQSVAIVGSGRVWGNEVDARNTYLLDIDNGATLLSIPVGHTLAAVQHVMGPIASVCGLEMNQCDRVSVVETSERLPKSAPDQLSLVGRFQSGPQLSVHYRGGNPLGSGLYWEIHGSEGDIIIEGVSGHAQMVPLTVRIGRYDGDGLAETLAPPEIMDALPGDPMVRNVAVMYARMAQAIRGEDTETLPLFSDGLALHRLVAAIRKSSEKRAWQDVAV